MIIGFIDRYFGLYYLLFFFAYLSIYLLPQVAGVLNVFILIFSYFLIIKRQRLDVVIVLILYARCINGFIYPHHKSVYMIINILTNVVPLLLYLSSTLVHKKIKINRDTVLKHKYTFIFFAFLTLSFLVNITTSYDLITKRYLPFVFFLAFLILYRKEDFDVYAMIRFFRSTFAAALLLYLLPDYLDITRTLIESDSVFSVASQPNSYSLVYFSLTRNMGYFWDHRILAIFSYLFLLLSIIFKPKYFKLDILLSLLIVLTTTSRGGQVTYVLILLAYLFQVYRYKLVLILSSFAALSVIFLFFAHSFIPPGTLFFLKSFSPNSEYNAISQRKGFSDYAMKEFKQSPVIGKGVGSLSSHTIERDLVVDGVRIPAAGDAYWYILLAEMGIVGFVLYLLFLMEVFYSSNIYNVALFVGFVVQLLGTDIPDTRFYYFAILVLIYIANNKLKSNALEKKLPAYEN